MTSCQKCLIAPILLTIICGCGNKSNSTIPPQNSSQQTLTSPATGNPRTSLPPNQSLKKWIAGQKYLEIVNPVNCAIKRESAFERANGNSDGTVDIAFFDDIKKLFSELSDYRQVAFRAMLNYSWPDDVQDEIRNLAAEWAKAAQNEQELSEAFTVESYNVITTQRIETSSTANPGLIRGLLGLDPAKVTDNC